MVDLPSILRDFFGISSHFFKWPFVLTELLIPFIVFTYALKLVLEKLGIFRSDAINFGLSALIALSSIFFVTAMGPVIIPVSIFMISIMKMGSGAKGIILGILLSILVFYATPFVVGYLTSLMP